MQSDFQFDEAQEETRYDGEAYTKLQVVRKNHKARELRAIHERALSAVENLKRSEVEVVIALQEADRLLVHRFIGYNSLKQYAMKALKLSEQQAYMYIAVARKSVECPALLEAMVKREITISKAHRLSSVIDEDSQTEWIDLAKKSSKHLLEKMIAAYDPKQAVPERVRFLNSTLLEMNTPIHEKNYEVFSRARELVANELGRPVTIDEAIGYISQFFVDKRDPVKKAERALARAEKKNFGRQMDAPAAQSTVGAGGEEGRIPQEERATLGDQVITEKVEPTMPGHSWQTKAHDLAAGTVHAVNLRDRCCCQQVLPDGIICGATWKTEIHHIVERELGGTDELDNLITLCKKHHEMQHALGI